MALVAPAVRPGQDPAMPEQKSPRRSYIERLRYWRSRLLPAAQKGKAAPRPKRNLTATLREWHKRAGLIAFVFLIWLAATGVLLTRSVELGFDATRVDWPWLMKLYGLHAEPPDVGYFSDGHWLASTAEFTVLDGSGLSQAIPQPVGFVSGGKPGAAPMLFVAGSDSLILLSATGERIDELRAPLIPTSAIRRIGRVKGTEHAIAIQDFDAFRSDDGGDSWKPVTSAEVEWSQTQPLPEDQRSKLVVLARPRVIVEQLLIDLHSGRLFGPIGAWAITLIGFVAMVLSGSGVWMWWRMNQAKRARSAAAR